MFSNRYCDEHGKTNDTRAWQMKRGIIRWRRYRETGAQFKNINPLWFTLDRKSDLADHCETRNDHIDWDNISVNDEDIY